LVLVLVPTPVPATVPAPVPIPAPVPVTVTDPDNVYKIFTKSCLFIVRSNIFSPECLPLLLDFFSFFIPFCVGSGSKSGSGTGTLMHSGFGSAKAKSLGSCGSGSTTLLRRTSTLSAVKNS